MQFTSSVSLKGVIGKILLESVHILICSDSFMINLFLGIKKYVFHNAKLKKIYLLEFGIYFLNKGYRC